MRRSYSVFVRASANGRLSGQSGFVGATNSISRRWNHSLALSVHFYHPALGMKSHEILSRATAFLLSVDPPSSDISKATPITSSPYDHLQTSKEERALRLLKQDYSEDPAGGPPRDAKELGWLEFCPRRNRPTVHVVAASHVLSPWNWPNYYPQDWLTQIKQEHVTYSLEVVRNDNENHKPLAKFACNPYPIHHPEGADLAIIHLKQEETALKHMEKLGVKVMHLTSDDYLYERNQTVHFEGFQVAEEAEGDVNNEEDEKKTNEESGDDERTFIPFEEKGNLIFASPTRFLAKTSRTLPEGLCGGPTLLPPNKNNADETVCGVIEGIVPVDHDDKKLAGAAAFLPAIQVRNFIEYAEREMLQKIVPEKLFQMIVDIKEGKGLRGGIAGEDNFSEGDVDTTLKEMLQAVKKSNTPEQADAILSTIEREKQEVMDILVREGGDLDEIIAKVRKKTRQRQQEIIEKLNEMKEAEIVSSDENKDDDSQSTSPKN